MNDPAYPYASGDLLAIPHTYFYADYAGQPFLDAWRAQRDQILVDLPDSQLPPDGAHQPGIVRGDNVETDQLLEHVFHALTNDGGRDPEICGWLSELLKKFEVTKRIHRAYGPGFRAKDRTDHKAPARYLRLAEIFEAAWETSGELPYLNVLLKCIDTLSTLSEGLTDEYRARIARLIVCERAHVNALAERIQVPL